MTKPAHPLDQAVQSAAAALSKQGVPTTGALILMSTGIGMLAGKLKRAGRAPLGRAAGVPAAWKDAVLHWGQLGGLDCWLLEDAPGPADQGGRERPGDAPWMRAFPVWLAAAAGARHLVHVSAAVGLDADGSGGAKPGTLVVASDHINLSGSTPLQALSGCTLGPLFPAVSKLHDEGLRQALLTEAARLGIPLAPAVLACTAGPALATPAERRYWRAAGAEAAVQELAAPLLAAAHAGLGVVALAAVVDGGDDAMALLLERAEQAAPQLEELLCAFAPHLAKDVAAAEAEEA